MKKKSVIDQILAGDFDEEPVVLDTAHTPSMDLSAKDPYPRGKYASEEPEEPEEDDYENTAYDDSPSESFEEEYTADVEATAAKPQYVEQPKQSRYKVEKSMNEPKQSTTTETARRGASHKLSNNTQEVATMYTSGVSAKEIAAKFNVSVSCVISTLKRANVTIRPKGRRPNKPATL